MGFRLQPLSVLPQPSAHVPHRDSLWSFLSAPSAPPAPGWWRAHGAEAASARPGPGRHGHGFLPWGLKHTAGGRHRKGAERGSQGDPRGAPSVGLQNPQERPAFSGTPALGLEGISLSSQDWEPHESSGFKALVTFMYFLSFPSKPSVHIFVSEVSLALRWPNALTPLPLRSPAMRSTAGSSRALGSYLRTNGFSKKKNVYLSPLSLELTVAREILPFLDGINIVI